ncbi:hypothetical protein NC651_012146 [Populus alba x Populus x berolinensis]|nr:hypothetical protein NC651_012146 [Populus alba x Populus x berolinensis]
MEDAYYEEEMGVAVNNMLSEAHMLVASTGKHQWIFSDASDGGWNSIASIGGNCSNLRGITRTSTIWIHPESEHIESKTE